MVAPYEDREQTEVKHQVLTRYLKAFVPIVGNWAQDIAYIDCLSGPWKSADPNLTDTSFANAIDVLRSTRTVLKDRGKSPTMRCLFVEKDPIAFNELKRYCEEVSDIEVTPKNWDLSTHVHDVVRFARERTGSFPFVFIDPTGWELLQIELIAPILRLSPGEVLITLMTSWITRFLSDEAKGFERLLGEDVKRIRQLEGEEQEDEIVRSYANSVRSAGQFKYVCTLPVMKPDQDSFHFHMIYGTRHERGVEVFKETEKHVIPFMHETRAQAQERRNLEKSGQTAMFDPLTRYREKKFTRFQLKNIDLAKRTLREQLELLREIPYENAWAIAMQYPTVLLSDLHEWLSEWESDNLLEISNQRPQQKWPQKHKNQCLRWRGKSS
jgi:three-Cys-motif partner protein